jgi:MFS family permease
VVMTFFVTRTIDLLEFPTNYALMFLGLSLGGLVSFYFSRKIKLAEQTPLVSVSPSSVGSIRDYLSLFRNNPAFTSFAIKKFVYSSALTLGLTIMPLFLVREAKATDSQIGTVSMAMSIIMLVGYFIWPWSSRKYGGRFVLRATTFGLIFYPALTAATSQVTLIIIYAAIAGFFQAGLDLVFFDEMMKTVPQEYSATFVSLVQSMQYFSAIVAPLVGIWLANYIGLGGVLWVSASLRLVGFLLFL